MGRTFAIVSVLALAGGGVVHADDIWLESSTAGKTIRFSDVSFVSVASGTVTYRMAGGATVTKLLAKVHKVNVTGMDAFNEAEEILTGEKPDPAAAANAYGKVKVSGAEEWLKLLVRYRRLRALNKTDMIDRAVADWLALMDSEGPTVMSLLQPARAAKKGSEANKQAIRTLKSKLKAVQSDKPYRTAVMRLLMKIYRGEGMDAEADKIADALIGKKPSSGGNGGVKPVTVSAAGLQQKIDAYVSMIRADLEPAKLAKAAVELEAMRQFCNREQLISVLIGAGKAQVLLSRSRPAGEKRKLLLAAGLNFMRVVAHFSESVSASEALYEAAGVNLLLGNKPAARKTYNEVVTRAEDPKFVAQAKKALADMK